MHYKKENCVNSLCATLTGVSVTECDRRDISISNASTTMLPPVADSSLGDRSSEDGRPPVAWDEILLSIPPWYLDSPKHKMLLIFSLLAHLKITVLEFLIFIFSTKDPSVLTKVRKFTAFNARLTANKFGPKVIWD
jgi:hypothetical protein